MGRLKCVCCSSRPSFLGTFEEVLHSSSCSNELTVHIFQAQKFTLNQSSQRKEVCV